MKKMEEGMLDGERVKKGVKEQTPMRAPKATDEEKGYATVAGW